MPQGQKRGIQLSALAVFVLAALVLHLAWSGSVPLSPSQVLGELFRGQGGEGSLAQTIIWEIRFPRGLGAAFVGAILAVVGVVFQSLFRNPLAEPYVLGVSSGAAFGGSLVIVFGVGGALGLAAMPVLGFGGALATLLLVWKLGAARGGFRVETLLIAGVVIGSMLSSLISLSLLLAGQDTNAVLRWLLGSLTPMYWSRVALLAGALVIGTALLWPATRKLNTFALGDASAQSLGVDVRRMRLMVLTVCSAMVGVAVGSVGIIPFLGLAAPHAARRLVGHDLRRLLPASLLTGSGLLIMADFAAQRIKPGWELPVGAVTAILGAPALLVLLRRNQGLA